LDSLDTVEVVMAIEEVSLVYAELSETLTRVQEFSIEIPDKEADAIHSGMFNSRRTSGAASLIV
jgi:NADH dehydrogenase (ubiquinone) 1 alpha/beta subcomplex 1